MLLLIKKISFSCLFLFLQINFSFATERSKDHWHYCPDLNLKVSENKYVVVPFDPIHFKLMNHAKKAASYLDPTKECNYAAAYITFVVSNNTKNHSDTEEYPYSVSSFLTTSFFKEENPLRKGKKLIFLSSNDNAVKSEPQCYFFYSSLEAGRDLDTTNNSMPHNNVNHQAINKHFNERYDAPLGDNYNSGTGLSYYHSEQWIFIFLEKHYEYIISKLLLTSDNIKGVVLDIFSFNDSCKKCERLYERKIFNHPLFIRISSNKYYQAKNGGSIRPSENQLKTYIHGVRNSLFYHGDNRVDVDLRLNETILYFLTFGDYLSTSSKQNIITSIKNVQNFSDDIVFWKAKQQPNVYDIIWGLNLHYLRVISFINPYIDSKNIHQVCESIKKLTFLSSLTLKINQNPFYNPLQEETLINLIDAINKTKFRNLKIIFKEFNENRQKNKILCEQMVYKTFLSEKKKQKLSELLQLKEKFFNSLTRLTSLTSLAIEGYELEGNVVEPLKLLTALTYLNFKNSNLQKTKILSTLHEFSDRLLKINLNNTNISIGEVFFLTNSYNNLTSLDIRNNNEVDNITLEALVAKKNLKYILSSSNGAVSTQSIFTQKTTSTTAL